MFETAFMQRAIKLAKKSLNPSPNPKVGAVIIKNKKVIATGWHVAAGQSHAETIAIRKAGRQADGATLFVTLEPCRHLGKTPPCIKTILNSGIREIVIGMRDPGKKSGGGTALLRKAGLKVKVGVREKECRELNQIWLKNVTESLPYLTLKLALTPTGSTIPPAGKKWITNSAARRRVQIQRAEHDAILVGINTVAVDNPRLTIHRATIQPVRIILDPSGRIPQKARLLREPGRTIVVTKKLIKISRAENLVVPSFQLQTILKKLKKLGITSIYIEGGAITAEKFMRTGLIDKIHLFYGGKAPKQPKLFGKKISIRRKEQIGSDMLFTEYCSRWGEI